jgi:choline monooxygenase
MNARIADLLGQFDPSRPLEQAHTVPARWYFDPELYELERRTVFGDTWQYVGRSSAVAQPGAFLAADVAGEPIVVIRDTEGVLRAFYNVCRHRAAPLVTQVEGTATRLRCRYHGWTYDLAGRLRGAPEFDGVSDFCREDSGLIPVHVETWGPFVWVHCGRQPEPLAAFLRPLIEHTAGRGVEALHFIDRREYEMNCNWKVFVDNFLDGGYHVNTVHPGLAGVLDYTQYRTEIHGPTSVQISPLKPVEHAGDPTVAMVRGGDVAMYWWVFPNFMLNLYQGVMDTNLVLPLGPERCRVIFDFYFADMEGDLAAFIRESIAVAHRIQEEDVDICEEVQRGLRSRAFQTGRFSVKREAAGYHFHQLLARRLRDRAECCNSSER